MQFSAPQLAGAGWPGGEPGIHAPARPGVAPALTWRAAPVLTWRAAPVRDRTPRQPYWPHPHRIRSPVRI